MATTSTDKDKLFTICFAICGFRRQPPNLLMVKSPAKARGSTKIAESQRLLQVVVAPSKRRQEECGSALRRVSRQIRIERAFESLLVRARGQSHERPPAPA